MVLREELCSQIEDKIFDMFKEHKLNAGEQARILDLLDTYRITKLVETFLNHKYKLVKK